MRYEIVTADCLNHLPLLPENYVDSVVTDPPYELGFMGKSWDASGIAYNPKMWAEVLRVLKPGGHLLGFGGSRTSHRMVCAVEDAGFEIRDSIMWLYGTGFPKSLNISKAMDKAAGVERIDLGPDLYRQQRANRGTTSAKMPSYDEPRLSQLTARITAPATEAAQRWEGWGTALKPAHEPIVVARKPISERNIAANVERWGTGGLNIDGCRIGVTKDVPASAAKDRVNQVAKGDERNRTMETAGFDPNVGRWPANIALDEDAAAMLDAQSGDLRPGERPARANTSIGYHGGTTGWAGRERIVLDSGGASRFFYTAKASRKERDAGLSERNNHPTVKPIKLMRWLVRLVTPLGGVILDPFVGSGSTGIAAMQEGFRFIGIEENKEYAQLAQARLDHSTLRESTLEITIDGVLRIRINL